MHHPVAVHTGEGQPLRKGTMVDVSRKGARLSIDGAETLPAKFTLLLSSNGTPRRVCNVSWRSPEEVGVSFVFDGLRPSRSA
jgi:hypothetical protein